MKRALPTYLISKLHILFAALLMCAVCTEVNAQIMDTGDGNIGGAKSGGIFSFLGGNKKGNNSNNTGNSFEINVNGAYGTGNAAPSCEKKSCNNSTCQLTPQANGNLPNDCPNGKTKRYDVDPNCVMNKNASPDSCMDTMPVSSITRVAETNCYRNAGWSRKRNHLGTDYAAVSGTIITAAADGTVVWAKPMGGAGRVIVMEHEKKCPCATAGCDNKYITVYMHLQSYIVTGGSVKKGTPIGYVGGSNYDSSTGTLYDPPSSNAYGPHLHFEIHSGAWNKGYTTLKSSIINPLCDDIQSFCGGCSYSVEGDCTGKRDPSQWTSLSEEAAASKHVENPPSGIQMDYTQEGMPSYDATTCDFHNFMLENDECLFCPLFKVLFNTAGSLAQKTYNALKDALVAVVIVAFAIWIAWYVLKQVSALEVKKPSKMIQEILVQAFRVLLVVLILKASYGQILKLTIDPIFNTGMNYVQTVTGAGTCSPSAPYMQGIKGYEKEMTTDAESALPLSMGQNIVCSIKSMQDAVWRVVAFGRECRCVGWKIKAYIKSIIPNFAYVLTGDFLIIAGLILLLAFPWCLIDCVLNMAIAAALLPAAVAAWAFKITSGHLKTVFNFFLNAMFNFVFLSIILYIIITVVNQFLLVVDQYSTEYDKLIDPIHGLAFWSVNGLKLLMVCLLGWVFLDKGKDLANEFAKAPSLNIGKKTGGLFAQMAERTAIGGKGEDGKRHGGALGILKGGKELVGLAGNRFIGTPARQKIGSIRSNWIMNNKNTTQTTDADGNTVYELNRGLLGGKRNIFGQKVTRRITVDADGKEIYTKERETGATQIRNAVRDDINGVRTDLIRFQDFKTDALFDEELPNGQTAQISDDGKTTSIFNKKGKLIRTQTTLDDGTVEVRNAKGKFIASRKVDSEGRIILKTNNGQSVYDENYHLLSADKTYRNPFLGFRKQTLSMRASSSGQNFDITRTTNSKRMEILGNIAKDGSDAQALAQNYGVTNERDLSSRVGTTTSVSKDHLLSVRQIKNAKGEVVQEDYAFNAKFVKYLVKRDGSIDTAMIKQLQTETKLSKEKINLAVAEQILKDRRIKLDNKFAERNAFYENGALTVVQKNLDGSTTHLTTKMTGNQMVIDVETLHQGSITRLTDNGIISRVITQHEGKEPVTHYDFNRHVTENSSVSHLMNFNDEFGRLAPTIDKAAAMVGFTEDDIKLFAEQEKSGKNQRYDKPFNAQERSDKIGAYQEACRFRRQAEQKVAQSLAELNKAKQEFEAVQSSLTSQNTAQLQGRANVLEQRFHQAQAAYNNAVNECNLSRARENQARADL